MSAKKILLIGPFPDPISGVSISNKVVKEILENEKGIKVSIVNTSYPFFKDSIGSFSIKKALFFLKVNFNVLKTFNNDIIYTTPGQTFFGIIKYAPFILLGSILKKELIIHVHGNHLGKQFEELKGIKKRIFYFLVSKFTKGIVLSQSLIGNLTAFLEVSKIFVVNNFAEDYLYENSKKEDFDKIRIVFLSNLMEEKGILFLLDALKKLEEKNIVYEAKIAGNIDDSLKDEIKSKIDSLNSTSYVGVLRGNGKKELLNWSTIFILPTFYKMEGQPIAILEALATENVIIATNHAGIPDIIKPEINGFFVTPKSEKSIFECFLYLSNNKEKIELIAKNNKEYFLNNFTLEKFKSEILKVLHDNPTVR